VRRDAVELLASNGPVATLLGPTYEPRLQQLEMASAVAEALDQRSHLLVEAATGVGKSFAYLAPAMLRALEQRERVVIATNTIALQEQLLEKDVPLLRAALEADRGEIDLKIVLAKGRNNYLSLRRLRLASDRADRLLPDPRSKFSLQLIERWAEETEDGTLSTLPPIERPSVWDHAQSDSGNCMGRKCPTYERCFYQRARRAMERADVLITNHALFFSDLALRSRNVGFLPPYDHMILDEAHAVEDAASERFGLTLSEGRVRRLLSTLYSQRAQKGFLPNLEVADDRTEQLDRTIHRTLECALAADRFFDALARVAGDHGGDQPRSMRVGEPVVVPNELTEPFRELAAALGRLKEACRKEADRFELNSYAERARAIADEADLLITQGIDGCAYWIESARGAAGRRVSLACSPIEVAPILRETLFDAEHSVVLTSATLTTRAADFSHIRARLGADDARALALGSPFDLPSQVEVYVDRAMPDPRRPDYPEILTERVLSHLRATAGGAFVLFTSLATMNAVARRLDEPLQRESMPLWVQGRDGSRTHILARFCENPRSVLLGVASFWQGVDVRGESLRNVIITRLPFEPPDRPLTEARLDRIRERGEDPFLVETIPRAVIRFKQGFGRLIRSAADEGRVVVLDPRIVTRPYGKAFLAAIPEGVRVHEAEPGSLRPEGPSAIL